MAMASLCAYLRHDRKLQENFTYRYFHAFIVDHGVRHNSHKEAIRVGRQLASWGILLNQILTGFSAHTSQGYGTLF